MNDSIVCEKCNYDLFMICPDGLTVCNHCGEFSSFPTHSPTVPPAIVEQIRQLSSDVKGDQEFLIAYWHAIDDVLKILEAGNE